MTASKFSSFACSESEKPSFASQRISSEDFGVFRTSEKISCPFAFSVGIKCVPIRPLAPEIKIFIKKIFNAKTQRCKDAAKNYKKTWRPGGSALNLYVPKRAV